MNVNRILLIVLSALLLQACGIKFWYNRIDWAASWFIDDYVELSDVQENRLETFIELKTEWHRTEELPKYVNFIESVKQDIEQGTVAENYARHSDSTRQYFKSILSEMSNEIVAVMSTFSSDQVSGLMDTLAKKDEERQEEFAESSDNERLEDREDNIKDGVSEWIGRLTKKQKRLVKEWASQVKSTFVERMAYRVRWRENVLVAMSERTSGVGQQKLLTLIQTPEELQSASMQAAMEHNRSLGEEYIVKIYSTLTKKQTKRLLNRLSDYQEDFQDLIDEGSDIDE